MTGWVGSTRRSRLPSNWRTIRQRVLDRDGGLCTLRSTRCTAVATEVHHHGDGDDHSDSNLRSSCSSCHKIETAHEAQAAKPSRRRPVERHPGLK